MNGASMKEIVFEIIDALHVLALDEESRVLIRQLNAIPIFVDFLSNPSKIIQVSQ